VEGDQQHGGAVGSPFLEHAAWLELIAALDWLPLPSLVLASDGTALGANQAWAAFSAAAPEAARGDGWLGVVEPLERGPLRARLCEAAAVGRAGSGDIRLADPAGGRWSRWWWRSGVTGRLLVCAADLDEHEPSDDRLERRGRPLGRLVRRWEFVTMAGRALRRGRWNGAHVAVVAVSLDGAADARDVEGRAGGDAVLAAAAERILLAVGPAGAAALVGRDEFVILCADLEEPGDARIAANRIRGALARPLEVGEAGVSIAASTGLAVSSAPGETAEALIGRACLAMRSARLDRLTWPAMPAFLPAGQDADPDPALDLAEMVVHRLFGVGLTLQSAADVAARPVADLLGQTVDELDAVIRDVRTSAFGIQQPEHPWE